MLSKITVFFLSIAVMYLSVFISMPIELTIILVITGGCALYTITQIIVYDIVVFLWGEK